MRRDFADFWNLLWEAALGLCPCQKACRQRIGLPPGAMGDGRVQVRWAQCVGQAAA